MPKGKPRGATKKRIEKYDAALMVALGQLTEKQIAEKCGVGLTTVQMWKRDPGFKAEVQKHHDAWRKEAMDKGIAVKSERIFQLNDRWERLLNLIAERAKDPTMQNVVGGTTGLLVRTQKMLGSGEAARLISEYKVDADLLEQLLKLEAQAAQELGQWKDNAPPPQPVVLVVSSGDVKTNGQVQAVNPMQRALLETATNGRPEIPGLVIDLVPER